MIDVVFTKSTVFCSKIKLMKEGKYAVEIKTVLHHDQCGILPGPKRALFSIKPEEDPVPGVLLGGGCCWNCHRRTKGERAGFYTGKPNWETFTAAPDVYLSLVNKTGNNHTHQRSHTSDCALGMDRDSQSYCKSKLRNGKQAEYSTFDSCSFLQNPDNKTLFIFLL